jgi:hypothetical protein
MQPSFWKLSQGTQHFGCSDMLQSIEKRLVYVHRDTAAKGTKSQTQAQDFITAPVGDYFYLTHGNDGVYLLGQFAGPANIFSDYGEGWIDRPFRLIFPSVTKDPYAGAMKWWTPNENSTFTRVPPTELVLFEEYILTPFFNVKLADYGL